MIEKSVLPERIAKCESKFQDLEQLAASPGELARELAELNAREPELVKRASKRDAAAGAELLVLNAKRQVYPKEIAEAQQATLAALGELSELQQSLSDGLILQAAEVREGLVDVLVDAIKPAVVSVLPPGAKPDFRAAAESLAVHLPGYTEASSVPNRLQAVFADHPRGGTPTVWPIGMESFKYHDVYRATVRILEVAKAFLRKS